MWDKFPAEADKWQASLPRHANCKRNCNDCAVYHGADKAPDGSTGTKCSVNIPKQSSDATLTLEDPAHGYEQQRHAVRTHMDGR